MSGRTRAATGALALAAAVSLAFTVAVPLDLLPWLRGPAPYPPEWQWQQRVPLAPLPASALVLVALALLLLAASGTAVLRRREVAAGRVLVLASLLVGLLLPLALLAREPAGALRALLARTTSFSITSYHTVAVSEEARDPIAFVRRHAELLPQLARTAKHAATHPPGAVLLFRATDAACEHSTALTEGLLAAAGVPERDFAPPLTRAARAGALLGALLLCALAAVAAWPIASLGRRLGLAPLAAARVALLWALLPGPALFAPRFDAAIAFPVAGFTALLLAAARRRGRASLLVLAALAALCAAVALMLSYGAATFLAIAGVAVTAAAADGTGRLPDRVTRVAVAVAIAAALALALAFGVPWLLGGAPLQALRTALAIHHEAYTAPRRYALWLVFDPADFAAFLGVAIACLAVVQAATAVVRVVRRRPLAPADAFGLAVLGGLAVLVLTGAARGEVGRLWTPIMPLVLVPAAARESERAWRAAAVGALVSLSTLAVAVSWLV